MHRSSALHSSELDRLLEPVNDYMLLEGVEHDEVDRYLREGMGNWHTTLRPLTDFYSKCSRATTALLERT